MALSQEIGTCDSEILMHLDKSIISLFEGG